MLASGTFHHVYDTHGFELPFGIELSLPYGITRFMVMQVIAALLTYLIFSGLAKHIAGGSPATGWFWNWWEYLVLRLRDEVVRPVIGDPHAHGHSDHGHESHGHDAHAMTSQANVDGHAVMHGAVMHGDGSLSKAIEVGHPADAYLPFILSCFFYILFCNLLGAFPWFGSATGNINVTAALALVAFGATYYYGMQVKGPVGFWTSMVPEVNAPAFIKYPLIVLLFFVESLGVMIKHAVLAIRLFCNIVGGHTVLGVILGFIATAAAGMAWWLVAPASIVGQIGVGLLELLVAFIQAYVFVFLTTIFISMGLHDH